MIKIEYSHLFMFIFIVLMPFLLKFFIKKYKYRGCEIIEGCDIGFVEERAVILISHYNYDVIKSLHSNGIFTWCIILRENKQG